MNVTATATAIVIALFVLLAVFEICFFLFFGWLARKASVLEPKTALPFLGGCIVHFAEGFAEQTYVAFTFHKLFDFDDRSPYKIAIALGTWPDVLALPISGFLCDRYPNNLSYLIKSVLLLGTVLPSIIVTVSEGKAPFYAASIFIGLFSTGSLISKITFMQTHTTEFYIPGLMAMVAFRWIGTSWGLITLNWLYSVTNGHYFITAICVAAGVLFIYLPSECWSGPPDRRQPLIHFTEHERWYSRKTAKGFLLLFGIISLLNVVYYDKPLMEPFMNADGYIDGNRFDSLYEIATALFRISFSFVHPILVVCIYYSKCDTLSVLKIFCFAEMLLFFCFRLLFDADVNEGLYGIGVFVFYMNIFGLSDAFIAVPLSYVRARRYIGLKLGLIFGSMSLVVRSFWDVMAFKPPQSNLTLFDIYGILATLCFILCFVLSHTKKQQDNCLLIPVGGSDVGECRSEVAHMVQLPEEPLELLGATSFEK